MVSLSGSTPWLSPPQVRVAEILRDTLGELLLLPEEAARRVIYMRDIYMLTRGADYQIVVLGIITADCPRIYGRPR